MEVGIKGRLREKIIDMRHMLLPIICIRQPEINRGPRVEAGRADRQNARPGKL